MRRALVAFALLTCAVAHAAGGSWVSAADELPSEVRAAAEAAGAIAEHAPERRLETARLGARPGHDAPTVETGLDGSWTIDWAGRQSVRASAAVTVRIVDPARARDAGETALRLGIVRLDALLARQEGATSALRTWILAWRAQQRLRLVRAARALPPPSDVASRRERARWLSDEPALELAAARLARELGRVTGGTAAPALPADAWDAFATGPVHACPDGDVGVVLARRHATATRQRATLHQESLAHPSVAVSLSADAGLPDVTAPRVDLGARVALTVGAPAAWPLAGRLRAETDPFGTTLSVEARHEPSEATTPWALEVAVADAAAAEARRRAEDQTWFDRAQWRRAVEGLRRLDRLSGPPTTFEQVRSAWERVDLVTHAADLRSRLALSCAIERALGASRAF